MLKTRSGIISEPPAGAPHDAELAEVIVAAQKEMERMVQLGELQSDPIRHPIQALSVHLTVLHRLFVDLRQQIEASRRPIGDEDVRRLAASAVQQMDQQMLHRWTQFNRAAIAIGVGVAMVMGAAAFGAGWWFGRGPELQCLDQSDGRVCFVWTLPPSKSGGG